MHTRLSMHINFRLHIASSLFSEHNTLDFYVDNTESSAEMFAKSQQNLISSSISGFTVYI